MESERRERRERIKDSDVAAENPPAGISELPAGNLQYLGQAVRFLYRAADFGSGRVLDPSLHTGKPGECDLTVHLSGSMPGNPDPASDHRFSNPGAC